MPNSYYVYEQGTNKLLELSDFPIPEPKYQGEFYAHSELTVAEIQAGYNWDDTEGTWEPKDHRLSKLEFLERFTMQERIAIRMAVDSDPVVADIMGMLELTSDVDLMRVDTQQSVGYLAQVGLIAPERVAEILAY